MADDAQGEIRHLRFDDFAAGGALHAALFAVRTAARAYQVGMHDHDFYEVMFVLAGGARHPVNGTPGTPLRPGDLIFLRPADAHAIRVPPGGMLQHVNVAFPAGGWRRFRAAAGGVGEEWERAALPTSVSVPEERRAACAAVFEGALHAYHRDNASPRAWLSLCAFLAGALPFLLEPGGEAAEEGADAAASPPWLAEALGRARRDPELLRAGLPRLVEIAGVSPSHLARVLKAATGRTPTAYVNDLRLRRAATLLTTTTLPVAEVGAECGFAELSYFYRLFRARHGCAPNAYRQRARRPIAP